MYLNYQKILIIIKFLENLYNQHYLVVGNTFNPLPSEQSTKVFLLSRPEILK
jgi:hypothetical protein